MKITATLISLLATFASGEGVQSSYYSGLPSYTGATTTSTTTSTLPIASTTTTITKAVPAGPPPCRYAFNPKTPGRLGISCPVYSPFSGHFFYGHPMTPQEYQQSVIDFQTKRVDNTLAYQQQYQAYTQDRMRYQVEINAYVEGQLADSLADRQRFELERLEYQNEIQRAHFERMEQQIPGFEVPDEYVDMLEQRQQWQREQLEYQLGLQEQKLNNYLEMQRIQREYTQKSLDYQQERQSTQLNQWAEFSKSQAQNPAPVFYGASTVGPRYYPTAAGAFGYNRGVWRPTVPTVTESDAEVDEEPRTDA